MAVKTFRQSRRFVTNKEEKQMAINHDKIFTHLLCTVCNFPRVTQGRYDHQKRLHLRITCHACGDVIARVESLKKQSRVIPINKSTPTYIHSRETLCQLNPKRTT